VIDSNDSGRFDLAKEELHRILSNDELRNIPLLIFANKQDMVGAGGDPGSVASKLELETLRGRQWHCQGCSAHTGHGLYEGMDWLTVQLRNSSR
jgi:signal recognition particle receptor subunit beta